VTSDLAPLPPGDTWVNARDFGAKGDGRTDDTDVLQKMIAEHPAIYLPSGFYIVHDTLEHAARHRLIGLHPGATQIILPDGTSGYQGIGSPKALLATPKGGSNIVIGIGLSTGGNNRRAVAALWKAGAGSLMNDVRFLGGHGTPMPDGTPRKTPTTPATPARLIQLVMDSQYPSLWVTDGGGGTFLDIWTPSDLCPSRHARIGHRDRRPRLPDFERASRRNEVQVKELGALVLLRIANRGRARRKRFRSAD